MQVFSSGKFFHEHYPEPDECFSDTRPAVLCSVKLMSGTVTQWTERKTVPLPNPGTMNDHVILMSVTATFHAFSALTPLLGRQEQNLACKN